MSRLLLLLTVLITACGSDSSGPKADPPKFIVYVDGANTGTPGPYCHVSVGSPAFLSMTSQEGVVDSVVGTVNAKPGRYRFSWDVDYYNSSGVYNATISSGFADSTDVPGGAYFYC